MTAHTCLECQYIKKERKERKVIKIIDPVGKLLFHEKKINIGLKPELLFSPPVCSFGQGYNLVIIAMLQSFLDAYIIIIC